MSELTESIRRMRELAEELRATSDTLAHAAADTIESAANHADDRRITRDQRAEGLRSPAS